MRTHTRTRTRTCTITTLLSLFITVIPFALHAQSASASTPTPWPQTSCGIGQCPANLQLSETYTLAPSGQSTCFDASKSTGGGDIVWYWGDGSTPGSTSGAKSCHVFANPGTYTVKVDSAADGACELGICVAEATGVVIVSAPSVIAPPPPPPTTCLPVSVVTAVGNAYVKLSAGQVRLALRSALGQLIKLECAH